jgi:hypothetical protein
MSDNHQDFLLMQKAIYASMQSARNNSSGVTSTFNYNNSQPVARTNSYSAFGSEYNRSRSANTRPRKTNSAGPLRSDTSQSSYNSQYKQSKPPRSVLVCLIR